MLDLLGDPIDLNPDPADPEAGFAEFWTAYPSAQNRRVGKPQALKKWIANGWAAQSRHIIAHVHHMKTEDCWLRGFHPLVLTYLNQQRWVDWEFVPIKPKPLIDPELLRLTQHKGAPPPNEIREKLKALRAATFLKESQDAASNG